MLRKMLTRLGVAADAPAMESLDYRDQCIARVTGGRTFADVGGLWGTVNEKVSVAAMSMATSVTMIDITPEGSDLWERFQARMSDLGISGYDCISADVERLGRSDHRPAYDVVHCSGVLYHHPEPLNLVASLRRITREYLILTSAITQERIENEFGVYEIPGSGVLFVPALNDRERAILAKYWDDHAGVSVCYGISEPVAWNLEDFGPWWYLPTARSMIGMVTACGLQVVSSQPTWNGDALTVVARVPD